MALALAGAFVSCSDDDEYVPGPQSAGAYFPNTNASSYKLTLDATSLNVDVYRTDASAAASYAISSDADATYFTVPTSVNFGAGENKATLAIGVNGEALGYDNKQTISLSLSENETTTYGQGSYEFTVIIPSPWTPIGQGFMVDVFFPTFWSIDETTFPVAIEENDLTPGYFRIVNPYTTDAYPYYSPGDETDPDATGYLYIDATDPDAVKMPYSNLNVQWGYGNCTMADYNSYTGKDEEGIYGKYNSEEGIISFSTPNSIVIAMADNGATYGNGNGSFKVYLPGVVLKDYLNDISYKGLYMDGTTQEYSAVVSINVGADVTSAKVGIMATRSEADVLQAMLNEEIETYDFAPGLNQTAYLPVSESGYYTAAIVAYDGEDQVGASSCTFSLNFGIGETQLSWDYIATGTYTYAQFWEGDDEGLELYECVENPDLFKIEHWGADVDFYFTWTEDGIITVQDQFTGYTHNSYGEVWVMELGDYAGTTEMGWSGYEEGVFTFNVVYYVSEGYFGYGPETFTLTATEQNAPKQVKAAKKSLTHSPKQLTSNSSSLREFNKQSPIFFKGSKAIMFF